MSESSSSLVECPVCGEEFDPTAAGGWCTNSECGQWRYDEVDIESGDGDEGDSTVDEGDDDATPSDPLAASDMDEADGSDELDDAFGFGDAADEGATSPANSDRDDATAGEASADDPLAETPTGEASEEPEVESAGAEGEPAVDEADAADVEADEEGASPGESVTEGVSAEPDVAAETEADELDAAAAAEPAAEGGDDGAEEVSVESVEAEDVSEESVEAEEVSEESVEVEEAGADADGAEETDCPDCGTTLDADVNFCPSCGADVSAVESADEDEPELTECPSCGSDVGPEDSFCASCGEDLDAHRGGDELTECPSCGDDVEPGDSFCAGCGEDLDAHRAGEADEQSAEANEVPERLVLATRGEELTVSDGDAVGRELRRIVTETGGDEDEAVRIHREHVRFVREDGQFYLVDLGRNPTRLNDVSMEKGDREPVGPGDEITLSDVISIEVREPQR